MPQNFISEAYKLSDWIRIIHFDIPDEPKYLREACRDLMALNNHCKECTALSGCYFISTKCPNVPQHPRCDCKTEFNYCPTIITYCDIRKFTDYIFADKYITNGKNIYLSLGDLPNKIVKCLSLNLKDKPKKNL